MSKKRTVVASIGASVALAGLSIATAAGPAGASSSGYELVAGSSVPWTAHARAVGDLASSKRLSVEVWLQPRTGPAADYATLVSTPGSASFHHYLSPSEYAARFGAGRAQVRAVESWLGSQGLTGATTDATHAYVRATGTVARIDSAFKVQMKTYAAADGSAINAGRYALQANDRAISLPASLASSVLGVTGLDNAAPLSTLDRLGGTSGARDPSGCSYHYGEKTVGGLPKHFGVTSFPTRNCGYTGLQIRHAYGADMTNTGKGQTIALVELGLAPSMYRTLRDYTAANGLPTPVANRYSELSIGAGTACGDEFDVEEQLDVEASYSVAPGASQLVVGGDSCDNGDFGLQGLFDADEAILDGSDDHPLASIASNSWEGGTETQPTSLTNIEHAYLMQAAAEGVGMYFSSGDGSGVEEPSADPYAIAVGGTTLGIGASGNRLFETGWSTGFLADFQKQWFFEGEDGAAGGGSSLLWKQPAYQKGVVPVSLSSAGGNRGSSRAVPDISADADLFTGFAVGLIIKGKYIEEPVGGTSLASPLVAGSVAAAQQGQSTPYGFADPLFYKLAGTGALHDPTPLGAATPVSYRGVTCNKAFCFVRSLAVFDDQSPELTTQVTLKGYDTMTGVGTPAGQRFITALRRLAG